MGVCIRTVLAPDWTSLGEELGRLPEEGPLIERCRNSTARLDNRSLFRAYGAHGDEPRQHGRHGNGAPRAHGTHDAHSSRTEFLRSTRYDDPDGRSTSSCLSVLISPPVHPGGAWTAKSDSQNRPL